VILALFILNDFALFDTLVATFVLFKKLLTTPWILKTLGFALLVGSIIALIERSGAIAGFIEYLQNKKNFIRSERSALLLSYFVGVLIFVESSITSLIAGAVGKPLCDKYKVPHAKLAYVCDSTSAPICSLIVLNGWGALLLGLVSVQIVQNSLDIEPVALLIESVLYNFYAMFALLVSFLVIWFDIKIGPMRYATLQNKTYKYKANKKVNGLYMVAPLIFMVLCVFFFLYLTGDGNILAGSGSSSIFYTMCATLVFMFVLYRVGNIMSYGMWGKTAIRGGIQLFPIVMILLFSFAIGEVSSELHTGLYLASLVSESFNPHILALIIFILSGLISFATGTSWGSFSIMIPVAVPMALAVDANVALCIGAVISGGVFGDHCSPISDTTIISSMASDCEVVEHVQTQLPYALISGVLACIFFVIFSYVTHG
jgi:Na+/H+ antiporter NhaC